MSKKTVAEKAYELLDDLAFEKIQPFDPDDEPWVATDSFDPMHGKAEIAYALKCGYVEHDNRDHGYLRLTPSGWARLKSLKRPKVQVAE